MVIANDSLMPGKAGAATGGSYLLTTHLFQRRVAHILCVPVDPSGIAFSPMLVLLAQENHLWRRV